MTNPLLKDPKFYTEDPLVFLLCDAYKTGHINQQPLGTDSFFENLTARSHTYFNTPLDFDGSVFMGLQRLVLRWLVGSFDNFFKTPFNQVEAEYLEYMDGVLGKGVVKSAHLKELHELGYIPLEIRAVPEGSLVPIRVPFLTIENTVDGFGWLTGYFEDLWSNELWKPCVLATKALHFRRVLEQYANETGAAQAFIDYQAHNFALRGMSGMFDDANSSVGQLIYFKGSDSFPSVWTANRFYNPEGDVSVSEIAGSVPACYDSQTKILTQSGFKLFAELTENDLVAQYHEDGSVDFVKPTEYYNMPYSGKMVSFKDQFDKIDILVTPNHRMIARDNSGEVKVFEAGDTSYQNRKGYSDKRDLIVSGIAKGVGGISPVDRLRIAFQADGSLPNRSESYKSGQMRFSLKKQRKIIRLLTILKETGFQYSISNVDARGYVSFWINPNDGDFLKDKEFNWVDISKLSGQKAIEFIEELEFWDGTRKNNTIIYSSTNLLAIEKVSAIAAIAGKRTNFGSYIDKREDCNRKEIYTLSICNRNTFCGVSIERDFIDYEGTVHCVSVPTKMLIVSRNNKVCISGNTEHSVTCLNIAVYAEELKATPEYANVTEAELLSKAEELFQRRLITEVYPSGIFSFVSDTNDFFDTITTKAIANKDAIMARDGKLVYRPDCYSSDTSILTPKGWKLFSELTDDDLVAQVLDDNSYEFVKPLKIINQEYKGPMHHFHDFHGKVDLLVTPNHRMVLSQKNPISGDWNERIVYAEKLGPEGNHLQRMYRSAKSKSTGKKITPLERLKIAFQADGSFLSKGDHSIRFSFAKPRKIDRLIRLADEAGIATSVYKLKDGRFEIHLKIDRSNFSKDFDWVDTSDLCSDWANGFIDELKYWDSSIRSDRRFKYDTTNPKIVPVVELIAIAAGKGVFINRYSDERKEIFSDVYSMHIVECNVVTGQGWKKDIVEYDGTVHCVTVPSGKVLVKRNRCILVSGNSGQPYHILCGYTWDGDNHNSQEMVVLGGASALDATKFVAIQNATSGNFESFCVDGQFYSTKTGKPISIEEQKGAVQILWEIFGGTTNAAGYKELDPHVGLIYGDAININTMTRILSRLKENGFCSSNVVFGVGSFEFQFVTRDTLGIAMKATAGKVNGKHYNIAKNPKTDDGTKKSAKGYLIVYREDDGTLTLKDDLTREQYETLRGSERDAMRTVYLNGDVKILESIRTIRERAAQWI